MNLHSIMRERFIHNKKVMLRIYYDSLNAFIAVFFIKMTNLRFAVQMYARSHSPSCEIAKDWNNIIIAYN